MRFKSQLAISFMALALTGCMASVGFWVDGRPVKAESRSFSFALEQTTTGGVTINLGAKSVQITTTQITWSPNGSLQLPANWSKLDLSESSDSITVRVDGNKLATIYPTPKSSAIVISQAN